MSTPNDPYDLLNRINVATGVTRSSGRVPKGPGDVPSLGQSRSSLIEDFGRPGMVDITETKSKRKEVLKFFSAGTNRYKLKVTVENGVVTGWEHKGSGG